jgi:hypothetical protein
LELLGTPVEELQSTRKNLENLRSRGGDPSKEKDNPLVKEDDRVKEKRVNPMRHRLALRGGEEKSRESWM